MRFVTAIKYTLVLGALTFTIWLFLNQNNRRSSMDILVPAAQEDSATLPQISPDQPPIAETEATNILLEPRYTGRDITGQTWEIKANQAIQMGGLEEEELALEIVTAKLQQATGEPLLFSAKTGIFQQTSSILTLQDQVQVQGYGMTLTTPLLTGQLQKRKIEAEGPLVLTGQLGDFHAVLEAGAFTLTDAGKRLFFSQRVRGRLTPQPSVTDNDV